MLKMLWLDSGHPSMLGELLSLSSDAVKVHMGKLVDEAC